MKHLFSLLLIALCALSCGRQAGAADAVLDAYAQDSSCHQLLVVQPTEGSQAVASYYVKAAAGWQLSREGDAFVGKNGVGKTREGDAKTPLGELHIGTAFGILPNPGTALPYIEATPSLYGCDDGSEYYNQLIDTAEVHHRCKGEHIIDIAPEYNYAITTSYNAVCAPQRGSCIFLHCKGEKMATAGCIALDEPFMLHILLTADSGMVIYVLDAPRER